MSDAAAPAISKSWLQGWPDVVAFGVGLALARFFRWETTDLVWSLWLSSLLVGYSMILWTIFGPVIGISLEARSNGASPGAQAALTGAFVVGGLFLLAFFTVHFGMFHLVHSVFLNSFFPLGGGLKVPSIAAYTEVFQRYWYFVPLAAIAERQAFRRPQRASVGANADPRSRLATLGKGDAMFAPYKNVIRMHLLIFFFAFAHIAGLDGFLVYAVIYAVYFFPWRLVRRTPIPQGTENRVATGE